MLLHLMNGVSRRAWVCGDTHDSLSRSETSGGRQCENFVLDFSSVPSSSFLGCRKRVPDAFEHLLMQFDEQLIGRPYGEIGTPVGSQIIGLAL